MKSSNLELLNLKGTNGFLSQEAYDYILDYCDGGENEAFEGMQNNADFWCDFMWSDRTGKIYAVASDGPVTSCESKNVSVRLHKNDSIYTDIKNWIDKYYNS